MGVLKAKVTGSFQPVMNDASQTFMTQTSADSRYVQPAAVILPPIGSVMPYVGTTAPSGGAWMICNGTAISRSTYSTLWNLVRAGGSTCPWGNGDGSSTFNLPNLMSRFPIGTSGTYAIGAAADTAAHTHAAGSFSAADHLHTLSDAGVAKVALRGTAYVQIAQPASGAWNSTHRSPVSGGNSPIVESLASGAGLLGTTSWSDRALGVSGSSGSTSHVPPYQSFNFIIRVL